MVKKFICGLLIGIMIVSVLTGCSNGGKKASNNDGDKSTPVSQTETSTNDSAKTEENTTGNQTGTIQAGKWKIGFNYYNGSSYALTTLRDNSKHVVDAFGGTSLAIDDERSVEKIIQDLENMISSGCDGLLVWAPADNLYPAISELCENAKIPFVLNDKIPSDPEVLAQLKANHYCVGAIGPDNAAYGIAVAQYALDNGYKTCIIASGDIADPTDAPRIAAFKEIFTSNGGTILEELHSSNADESQNQLENAFIVNPNPDFIYATGPDYCNAATNALGGKGYKTVILTSGLDTNTLDRLVDPENPVCMTVGDYWICGMFSAIIMQNYLDGTPLLQEDGKPIWYDKVAPFPVSDKAYDLYKKFFIEQFAYTPDEIRQMSGANNPEFNYNKFVEIIKDYSLESVLMRRYQEGKITAEEMRAAGFDVK